jgi:gamma-butyrobetaine dioxygenase
MSNSGIDVQRTCDPGHARLLIAAQGAAILTGYAREAGESWPDFGVRMATAVLGEDLVQIVPQFEASVASEHLSEARRAATAPEDPLQLRVTIHAKDDLFMHNDGYAVGDHAPDRLFLLLQTPAQSGGQNVFVDAAALVAEIEQDDPELHHFLLNTPVDQSEPAFDVVHEPIARILPSGTMQVRRNPYQSPLPGSPALHPELCERWAQRVIGAAATAPEALLASGELACFDNYRVLHGRRGYVGDERAAHSIWGWTREAVAVLPLERELAF